MHAKYIWSGVVPCLQMLAGAAHGGLDPPTPATIYPFPRGCCPLGQR
jgi:hypothetical protein